MRTIELDVARLAGGEPASALGLRHWGDAERAIAREYRHGLAALCVPVSGAQEIVVICEPGGGGWGVAPTPDGPPVCWPLADPEPQGVPVDWTVAARFALRRAGGES